MGNPHNRPKYKQHRSWFRIEVDGKQRVIRPVNAEDWYNEPGFSVGLVHMVDEFSERVGFCEIGYFERNATRVSGEE